MSAGIAIRTMKAADAPIMGSWAAAEGWTSETSDDFLAFLDHDPDGCLILEYGGEPAAVCVATVYGQAGFLGEMIVSRAYRGLGLGPILFDRALSYLRGRGCRSVSLDAVPKAAAFYETRGFKTVSLSRRFRGRIPPSRGAGVWPMGYGDLPKVSAIDLRAFGADRSFFLKRRLDQYPELAWVRLKEGRIVGYIFGRRREGFCWPGPIWSADAGRHAAFLLRGFAMGAGDVDIQVGVLDINTRAVALMRRLGFEEKREPSRRMALGEGDPVGLQPGLLAIGTAGKG